MYALRPVSLKGCTKMQGCSQSGTQKPVQLAGYGVEMAIKNMEYSALDDSQVWYCCLCHAYLSCDMHFCFGQVALHATTAFNASRLNAVVLRWVNTQPAFRNPVSNGTNSRSQACMPACKLKYITQFFSEVTRLRPAFVYLELGASVVKLCTRSRQN